jgi:soluble lytic murein transglycosylase-like protein
MPATGREQGVASAAMLFDPQANLEAGVKYLKWLLARFDGDLTNALAAYNAGPGAVARYRGVPPFRETRNYVRKVLANFQQ